MPNFYEMNLVRETAFSLTFTIPNFPALRYIHVNKITGVVTIRTNNFFFTCILIGNEFRGGSFRYVDPEDDLFPLNPPTDV
ncbi:Transporter [Aphis craccivora]|uniref:Transporter n=1 Tax=Aphis craccivora TaxID=307492 RepID=A0A6G0YDU5_APHCR|nr:Transporter [Aphis craccivora]